MKVSVIIPTFNNEATIASSIDSAFAQDPAPTEVIVVDDGSTDSTPDVIRSYGSRISVVTQENRGVSMARNAGAAIASGEYLAFLDADDEWMPGKLARTIPPLEKNPSATISYSDYLEMDAKRGIEIIRGGGGAPAMSDLLSSLWPILPSTVVMRRSIFEQLGGFQSALGPGFEDSYLWLRCRELGGFEYVPAALVRYRKLDSLDKLVRYDSRRPVFIRLVQARYGSEADKLARYVRHLFGISFLQHALSALDENRPADAKRAIVAAFRTAPLFVSLNLAARLLQRRNLGRVVRALGLWKTETLSRTA